MLKDKWKSIDPRVVDLISVVLASTCHVMPRRLSLGSGCLPPHVIRLYPSPVDSAGAESTTLSPLTDLSFVVLDMRRMIEGQPARKGSAKRCRSGCWTCKCKADARGLPHPPSPVEPLLTPSTARKIKCDGTLPRPAILRVCTCSPCRGPTDLLDL